MAETIMRIRASVANTLEGSRVPVVVVLVLQSFATVASKEPWRARLAYRAAIGDRHMSRRHIGAVFAVVERVA